MLGPAVRMLVSLGVVLAVMYVAARLLRHTRGGSVLKGGAALSARLPVMGSSAMRASLASRRAVALARRSARRRDRLEVLARQPLGKTASVAVLRIAGRTLLVGVTDTAVQLLTELDPVAFDGPELQPDDPPRDHTVSIPDAEFTPDIAAALVPRNRSSVSVMDVLRERTVRRA